MILIKFRLVIDSLFPIQMEVGKMAHHNEPIMTNHFELIFNQAVIES